MEGRLTTAESKLSGIEAGANKTIIDSSLSSSSTNPVQNKIINNALNGKANTSHTHSYLPLSGGTLTGSLTVENSLNVTDVYAKRIEIADVNDVAYVDFHTTGNFNNDYNSRIIARNNDLYLYSENLYVMNSKKTGVLGDWVVAEGISGSNWYYRKWASGYAECWNNFQVTTFIPNPTGDGSRIEIALPFTFANIRMALASSISPYPLEYYGVTAACIRKQSTQSIQICSDTSNTLKDLWVSVYCTGTWK